MMLYLIVWLIVKLADWFRDLFYGRYKFFGYYASRRKSMPVGGLPDHSVCRNARKAQWVRDEIIRLCALMPHDGCRKVSMMFNRIHRSESVSKSFVAQLRRERQYEIADLRRYFKHRVPRAVPINRIWAMDMTGKTDAFGVQHDMLGLIDHGSRRLLGLTVLSNRSAVTLLGHLFLAIGEFGMPRAIRTDNESSFVSGLFTGVLRLLGIQHQRTDKGCPWMNGKIERVFATFKPLLRQMSFTGVASLQVICDEFRCFYNLVRPHQHLQGKTPFEVWREQANADLSWFKRLKRFAPQPKQEPILVSALDGLMTGYFVQRE